MFIVVIETTVPGYYTKFLSQEDGEHVWLHEYYPDKILEMIRSEADKIAQDCKYQTPYRDRDKITPMVYNSKSYRRKWRKNNTLIVDELASI